MKAAVCDKLGEATDPGVLRISHDEPIPALVKGHVRIKVVSASINFPDYLQIKGEYQVKPKLPFIPGSEVSGIIVELGEGVRKFRVGDKVCAIKQGGAFAEEVVVQQGAAWKVPDGVDLATMAAVPVVYGTAELALRHRAQLKPGQTVLVFGAGGGVGLAAVQIAKLLGAKVVAVDLGPDKAAFLRSQGADVVVDASQASKERPLHKMIKAAAPQGANVVFDPVGTPVFSDGLKCVAWAAQYIVIGFAGGGIPRVPANILLVKNTTLHGVFWGAYMQYQPDVVERGMRQVLQWISEGRLQVAVSHRYDLVDVREAFAALLQRKVMGKMLLLVDPQASPRARM